MKVRIISVLLIAFLLCGCDMFSAREMFEKPEIPAQYSNLLTAIETIKSDNFEYVEPLSGLNRQPLQLMDLDGDGVDEGVALLRDTADAYKVCIYIFKQRSGAFELLDIIESEDDEIYTVSYSNLLGIGNFEVIVEWGQAGLSYRPLSVYRVFENGAEEILNTESAQYSVSDVDQDGLNEFIVANLGYADVYRAKGTELGREERVSLAEGSGEVLRIKSGGVADGQNGVYIECAAEDAGILTSLIISRDGQFVNALPNGVFCSVRALCEDVNGDGIVEIPVTFTTEGKTTGLNKCYNWCVYTQNVGAIPTAFTYHSFSENWFLAMPLSWSGAVTSRRTMRRTGQIAIDFYTQEKAPIETAMDKLEVFEPELLFTVYILTGEMRSDFAKQGNCFILHEREDTIFAAEISKDGYIDTAIDEEFLKTNFKIRESEWISEILFA